MTTKVRLFVEVDVDVAQISTADPARSEYPVATFAAAQLNRFLKQSTWAKDAECVYIPPLLKSDRAGA